MERMNEKRLKYAVKLSCIIGIVGPRFVTRRNFFTKWRDLYKWRFNDNAELDSEVIRKIMRKKLPTRYEEG